MLLSRVFDLLSMSFPMYLHGESFWAIPYSPQKLPTAPQMVLSIPRNKAAGPTDQPKLSAVQKNRPRHCQSGAKQTTYHHM